MMGHRRFYVEDQGVSFDSRAQLSGISQGCTQLSIMTMTMLMHDAVSNLDDQERISKAI